jgi:mannitol-1-phosphate 5-dehydrogenase
MKSIAVQFGAGNIGRGFIAQLFHESGLDVVFVDVVPEILATLNERHSYEIEIAGPEAEFVPITNVRAIDGRDTQSVAAAIADCDIACTAVGAIALPHIAPNLAAGLRLRHERGRGSLNVLICENLHNASELLRELVSENLFPQQRDAILAQTGFAQAVVSRMVPLTERTASDPLAVRVEAYKRLPVDGNAIVGEFPDIEGIEPVQDFVAHVERKLYIHNCAHAVLGYVGYYHGLRFGYEALESDMVRAVLDSVLLDTSDALIRRHGFDPAEQNDYVVDLLKRFSNRALGDTCFRLARDPIRKLAADDRLSGAARMCESEGIYPAALAKVIACALCFDAMEDPSAVRMQDQIRVNGIKNALSELCSIEPSGRLGRDILAEYQSLRQAQCN